MECLDFLEFQEGLKRMRDTDDKIIYMLNTTLPTETFRNQINTSKKCEDFFTQLQNNYNKRQAAIQQCIKYTAEKVKNLRSEHESNPDDTAIMKSLKREQNKARLLQTELGVDEVVKDRSLKLYYERCRPFYKPPNFNVQ